MLANMLEIHARTKLNLPETWTAFSWACLPLGQPTQTYELIGGVESKGPRGKRTWAEPHATVYISPTEHATFCAQWELSAGLCHECHGEREVAAGWSRADGKRMRPCPRCKGTGKRPTTPACTVCNGSMSEAEHCPNNGSVCRCYKRHGHAFSPPGCDSAPIDNGDGNG